MTSPLPLAIIYAAAMSRGSEVTDVSPILVLKLPDGPVPPINVAPPGIQIGRSKEGNDLVIDSAYVSRQHVKILLDDATALIQDLGSTNGTWVNGVRLGTEPTPLPPEAEVVLGHSSISFSFQAGETTVRADIDAEGRGWTVDLLSREVHVHGVALSPPLSRKDFDILSFLWQRRHSACSRFEIAARGWPERSPGDVGNDEIDQYIRRIRRRIGDAGGDPGNIKTIRRFGYKLD